MNQVNFNLATIIEQRVKENPDKIALVIPKNNTHNLTEYQKYTFLEFWERVSTIASGIKETYVEKEYVSIFMSIELDLYATVIAMFARNITPVFMEPGMGRKNLNNAIEKIRLDKFLGKQNLLKYRWIVPSFWKYDFYSLDSKGIFLKLLKTRNCKLDPCLIDDESTALITFTSGSSGIPKGANRTFQSLYYQHLALEKAFPSIDNDVDMTCFPMVVLHNLCCGVTSFIPAINFKDIGGYDPAIVCRDLVTNNVTRFTAAPKFMEILVDYMIDNQIKNTNIRELAVGGAVVNEELVEKLELCFPKSKSWIIYGSTEAEPMAKIDFKTFLSNCNKAEGYLVGKVVEEANIKLIDTQMLDINNLPETIEEIEVKKGEKGEIVVSGNHVLKSYINNEKANREIKLKFSNGVTWHRTNDIGHFSNDGLLWLYGRVGDMLVSKRETISPFAIEKQLNKANQKTVIIQNNDKIYVFVESKKRISAKERQRIYNICERFSISAQDITSVKHISKIPVDKRHQSKVDRKKLRGLL